MYIVTANENKNLNTRRYNQLPFTAILLIDGLSFKCCLVDNWECIKKAGTILRHRPLERRRRDSLRGAYGVKPLKNLLRSFGCSNPCQIVNLAHRKRPAPFRQRCQYRQITAQQHVREIVQGLLHRRVSCGKYMPVCDPSRKKDASCPGVFIFIPFDFLLYKKISIHELCNYYGFRPD